MDLKEAIRMLNYSQSQMRLGNLPDYSQNVYQSIEKVLQELDNLQKENELAKKALIANSYEADEINTLLVKIQELQKENEQLRKISKMIESYPIGSSDNTFILIEKREFFNNPYFKNLLDDYISKDKIREKIEELKQDFLEYTEEFQGKCDDTDEYYFYDTQNMQNKINLLENLLKEE